MKVLPFLENVEITIENREKMKVWLTDNILENLSIEDEEAMYLAENIIFETLSQHNAEKDEVPSGSMRI